MTGLIGRSSRRYVLRHPWQIGLAALGIALGVAVVLSVDLAIGSARRAFTLSTEAVAGRATHRVVGAGGVPDSLYARLAAAPGVVAAAPVIQADVVAGDSVVVRLLGVDPLAEGPFRPFLGRASGGSVTDLLEPGAAALTPATAERLGVGPGDTLAVSYQGRRGRVRVTARLEPRSALSRRALDGLLVVDVATAQDLLRRSGLDRIELILEEGSGPGIEAVVRSLLPPASELERAGSRAGSLDELTAAFELNLRALGLLALVFGVFLIYNSMTFSVVQRRELIGTLRVLGVTRREVLGMVVWEAAALGVVGTALGVVLGVVLGRGLVGLVTRTINDLYFVVQVRELALPPAALAKAVAMGLGATVLATLPAAVEATLVQPRSATLRSTLEDRLRAALPWVTAAGVGLGLVGTVVLVVSGRSLTASFAGLFGIILACAALIPGATLLLMRLARPVAGAFGILGRMAAGGVAGSLSRTAPAIAALTIAVSVAVGVGVMIESFRGTVVRWLDRTLQADVYVSPPAPGRGGPSGTLAPGVAARVEGLAVVARARRYRNVEVLTPAGTAPLTAVAPDEALRDAFEFLEGDPDTLWPAFRDGEAVIVSEPYAYRRALSPGDTVRLRTAEGLRAFPVVGVYRDYGSDRGRIMMARPAYVRLWHDDAVTSLSVFLADGDADAAVEAIRRATAPLQRLFVRSQRGLREASLEVFDRTFAITAVLRLLALVVAFVGVVSALMALQLERARELGVLRANGLTPRQVWQLVASQTGLMGLAAGLLSLPVGMVLAAIMIYVVNRRSFGWTIELAAAPGLLVQAVLVATVASLLAGLYPSYRMAGTSPATALREG